MNPDLIGKLGQIIPGHILANTLAYPRFTG